MKTDQLYDLKEKVCTELGRYAQKDLSSTTLEFVDKLAHAGKNIGKLIEMCEEDGTGYSGRSYYSSVEPGRDMSSYRSYARGRDSMGRYSGEMGYSRHGDMSVKLRELIEQAPDEKTRRELERIASQMDH